MTAPSAAAPEERSFALELTHVSGYEFRVKFDWPQVPELLLDEPAPLGTEAGPNASRLLAAALANCLSASLLFCLHKSHAPAQGMTTRVRGTYTRNAKGRLRIGGVEVTIAVQTDAAQQARLERCTQLFEDFCVVTQSVRQGFPIKVRVENAAGALLYEV
jgi:organic hydroperoxide reductase OsmC/OhrA